MGFNASVTVEGPEVEAARTKAITEEEVREHIDRMGTTPFYLSSLEIDLDEGVGMGFSMFAILAGVMEMAARSLAGMFLVPALGYFGAALGSPLAWVAADLFLVPAYFRCRRVLMSQSHHLHVMGESAESN